MSLVDKTIFDRVIYIGPDLNDRGGISSVLGSYSHTFPVFHHLASNSRYGTAAGALRLLWLMLMLPVERMKGRRILHIHGAMGKSWVRKTLIMRWGKLLGFKMLYHCHAGSAKVAFSKMGIDNARRVLDCYDGIIAISESWREYFAETFDATDRTFKINNIVVPPANLPRPRRTDGKVRFLFLGMLCEQKGIFDLLQALHTRVRGDYKLTVGGNGEVDRFKAEVGRLGLGEHVEYVGWVTGEKKERLMREADVLILPSYIEGLPVSILEAMANNLAVISTPVGGIPEIITDGVNGQLITPGDLDGIAAAINRYIANPTLARAHGRASADRIKAFYPDAVVASLAAIYASLLD